MTTAGQRPTPGRLLSGAGVVAAGALLLSWILLVVLRSMIAEREVAVIHSITGELGVQRILVVFAHPDDEIGSTELISRAVREGAHVSLVTATRGEAGSQTPKVVDPRHLGVVREAEAYKVGWALGVSDQKVLDLGDGQLENLPKERLAGIVAAEIERVRPNLVVTFHPESGLTLHRDHQAIGAATVAAAGRAEVTERPRVAFVLAPRPGLRRFGGPAEREVAALQPAPDFSLVARTSLKRRAWRIHASQEGYLRERFGLPSWVVYLLMTREYYALEPH